MMRGTGGRRGHRTTNLDCSACRSAAALSGGQVDGGGQPTVAAVGGQHWPLCTY
jgi:hypothetical protein